MQRDTSLSPSCLGRGSGAARGAVGFGEAWGPPDHPPAALLISKVAVIRSSCWGRRWEGVKSYTRSYKQCVPINQIKAERVYFQKVCFLHRAWRQRAFGGRGEGEGGKGGELEEGRDRVCRADLCWVDLTLQCQWLPWGCWLVRAVGTVVAQPLLLQCPCAPGVQGCPPRQPGQGCCST